MSLGPIGLRASRAGQNHETGLARDKLEGLFARAKLALRSCPQRATIDGKAACRSAFNVCGERRDIGPWTGE